MQFKDHIRQLPAYKPPKLTALQPQNMIKLSSNENPLGPSPRAVAAMHGALANAHRYPDASALALREALARHADLPPEMVICSNGSDELVYLLCVAFLREGDDAVMADGTFISYMMRTRVMGANPVYVPLRDYTHDLPAMAAAITPRTRIVFVCNPNNPTGTTVGAAAMQTLLDAVPDDVLVVVDEAYYEYVTRSDFPHLLPQLRSGRSNIILLRTFAKIHGLAGLRLGYGYAHRDVITYLNQVRPVFNVNAVAQAAGIAALEDTDHIAHTLEHTARSREYFTRELPALGLLPIHSETNFMAINVGDDGLVTDELRERGFTVTPLKGWGVPGCIRASFGTMEQNTQFIAALKDMRAHHPVPPALAQE